MITMIEFLKLIVLTSVLGGAIIILLNRDIPEDYHNNRPPYEKDAIHSMVYVKYGFFRTNYNSKVIEYYKPGTIIEDETVRTGFIQIDEIVGTDVIEGKGKYWVFKYRMFDPYTIETTGISDGVKDYIEYSIYRNIGEIKDNRLTQSDIDYLLSQLKVDQRKNEHNMKLKKILMAIIQCFDGGCFVNLLITIYESFFGEYSKKGRYNQKNDEC